MAFVVFTVFMVCLIGTSFVMGLVGVVFDAVHGSSAVPYDVDASEPELSLIRSDGPGLQGSPSARAACAAHSFTACR
jgi:hypothetical protein